MSLTPHTALATAKQLLDGLTRDTAALSRAVAELEDLASVRQWRAPHQARFVVCKDVIGELVERYRTGASILAPPRTWDRWHYKGQFYRQVPNQGTGDDIVIRHEKTGETLVVNPTIDEELYQADNHGHIDREDQP